MPKCMSAINYLFVCQILQICRQYEEYYHCQCFNICVFLQCKIKNKLNLQICYTKYSVRSMTAFISSLTVLDSYIEGKKKPQLKFPTTNP